MFKLFDLSVPDEGYSKKCVMHTKFDIYVFITQFTHISNIYLVLAYVTKSSFLDFIGRFVFFFLQEAVSKFTLVLQYNSKMASY
jgi:hypothetical protein